MQAIILIGPQEWSSRSFQSNFFFIFPDFFLWCIKCVSHFRFGADFLNVHGAVIPRVTCNAAFHNIFWSVTLHGADVSFYGLNQGPLKKWTEHLQDLHILKIHSKELLLHHELLYSQKVHIKIFLMRCQKILSSLELVF